MVTNPDLFRSSPFSSKYTEISLLYLAVVMMDDASSTLPSLSKFAAAILSILSDCSKKVAYLYARASVRSVENTNKETWMTPVNDSLKSPVPFQSPEWLNTFSPPTGKSPS